MFKERKAQGLSFNVIIIAILALVVLVVLLAIFSQKTGKSVDTLESCEARGGNCDKDKNDGCSLNEFELKNAKCSGTKICCVNVFKEK